MNTELLYQAITLIDDDLIDEAGTYTPKKRKVIHWKRWIAPAACLFLAVGIGSAAYFGLFNGMGAAGNSGVNASGEGVDGSSTFMSYAGPVFPLSTLEEADGIEAARDITLDFDRTGKIYGSDITVTDAYTLTNTTAEDQVLSLLYPFVSSLMDLDQYLPSMTVNGEASETDLLFGLYAGGFQGVLGADDPEGSANLEPLTSWEGYKALLSDRTYLQAAMEDYPDFTATDVIVYEFTDPWGPEETDKVPNPSIRVTFDMDYDKTIVLSYGFHAGSFDSENGKMGQGFSIPQSFQPGYGEPYYLIVLGDDVKNMEIRGYVTGGWDPEKELDEFGVDVQRYETDLDTVLRKAVGCIYNNNSWQYGDSLAVDFEIYYGLFCDYLTTYGILSEDCRNRYDTGWLEDLSEVGHVNRVCWLQAQVTIPAGETVSVSAVMEKEASYDFYCSGSDNRSVKGYDMVTRLGSTLTFTGQQATLLDHGQIEIVRQNFGFDLAAGIKTVDLDPAVEHYYLEIRRIEN